MLPQPRIFFLIQDTTLGQHIYQYFNAYCHFSYFLARESGRESPILGFIAVTCDMHPKLYIRTTKFVDMYFNITK